MGLAFANQLIQSSHPKHLCCGISHGATVPLPSCPRARYLTVRDSLSVLIPLKSFSLANLDLLILPHLFLPPETTVKALPTVPLCSCQAVVPCGALRGVTLRLGTVRNNLSA